METEACEEVFPMKHGNIPASYVSLPEGNQQTSPGSGHFFERRKKNGLSATLTLLGRLTAAWSQFRCRSSHSPFGVFGCAHRLDNTPEV